MAQEAATAERYRDLTFVQLKAECQKRGLDITGTKDNLLKRLVNADLGGTPKRSPSSPSLSQISQLDKADKPDPKSARSTAISPRARAAEIDAQMTKPARSPEVTSARRRSTERVSRSKTSSHIGRDDIDKERDGREKTRSSSRKDKDRGDADKIDLRSPPRSPKPKTSIIEPRRQRESDTERDDRDRERNSGDKEPSSARDRDRDRVTSPGKERSNKSSPKDRDSRDKREKESPRGERDKKEKKDKKPRESPRSAIERPGSPSLPSNPTYSPPPQPAMPPHSSTPAHVGAQALRNSDNIRPSVSFVSPRLPASTAAAVAPIPLSASSSGTSVSGAAATDAKSPDSPLSPATRSAPPTAAPPKPPSPKVIPTLEPRPSPPPTINVDLSASIHALAKGSVSVPASAAKVSSAAPSSPKNDLLSRSPSAGRYLTSEIVYLSCQNIKDEDAFKIAEEMVGDAKTRELLLGGNAISSHGGAAMAKALERNTTLKKLVMGDNPMGDVAGTAFAMALRVNTTLQELSLSNTALSNATARAFQASRPTLLHRLVLHGNGMISAEGGRALLDLAIASPNLQELDLRHTEVLPEIIEEIIKVLRPRRPPPPTQLSRTPAPLSAPAGPSTPPGERPKPSTESPRQVRATKAKKFPARTVTAVIEEGVLSAMPLQIEISPAGIVLHYAPAPPRQGFTRQVSLSEAKSFYGKGNDLRFTWRLKSGALVEELFECEKAAKIVKRLTKWTRLRAEEEAKLKKKEVELAEASSPAKSDSGKNIGQPSREQSKEKSLIRAFSQSKLSQLVAGNSTPTGGGGKNAGHGSLRPQSRKEKELVITRPTSMVHKTHVDRELQWTGEAEFQLAEKIGGGAFASVYRAVHESGVSLAIKVVSMGRAQHDQLRTEVDLLKRCRDFNIVRLYGTIQKDDSLWILMDYCAAGSVLDLMKTLKRTLTEEEIAVILLSVLKGLAYLHREGIIHRDLKGANILLGDDMGPKIADFGVSAQIGAIVSKRHSIVGTPLFMSPETLDGASPSMKSDVWSVGIMAIELAEGQPPYASEHVLRAMKLLCTEPPPRLKEQGKWSEAFHSFIAACLRPEPSERPTAVELLSHPFILQAIASGGIHTVPVRLATEFGLVKRVQETGHTSQNLKFSVVMDEKDGPVPTKTRSRSISADKSGERHARDEIEVRTPSNELPWETLPGEEPERGRETLSRQLSGGKMSSPRDTVSQPPPQQLHISSPFGIVSAGELREKLAASERRNTELEAQLAEARRSLASTERQLAAEKQWNADLGQLLGGVLELRVAADKLERDFKGFLAKRNT